MDFATLDSVVPYVTEGELHQNFVWLYAKPEFRVGYAQPGKYRWRTIKPGGDMVVVVDDPEAGWSELRFKHSELFLDIELKRDADFETTQELIDDVRAALYTADPELKPWERTLPGVHPQAIVLACQLLGLAEWRRYAYMEPAGGRALYVQFLQGIADRKFSAAEAGANMRSGLSFIKRHYAGTPIRK